MNIESSETHQAADIFVHAQTSHPYARIIIRALGNLKKLTGFLDTSLSLDTASPKERELLIHQINDDSARNLIGRF